jgi:hypothetical protein
MFLRVHQIYFNQEQLADLDYVPTLNNNCTPYFENTVIRNLVESNAHLGNEYFGVVSHKLRHKIGFEMRMQWKGLPNIANHSTNQFTPQSFHFELNRLKPDAMSFQRHAPHDPVTFADQFHPNFSKYFREIMYRIGYLWTPDRIENVFYCNFFVAKSEIYERYVREMLGPAMDVMETMPELMGNSLYPNALPENLKQSFGVNHYPYHTFLCERMFSYFAHIHKLKCMHY